MAENSQRSCPSCRSPKSKILGRKNDFQVRLCKDCQTLYVSTLPHSDKAEDYDEYYTEANLTVPNFIYRRLEEIIDEFAPFREHNRFLDIGFGAGTILQVADKKHWEVFGVEVSKPAAENAEKLGFKVFHGELAEAKYPDDYFDVVTASEILEHLPKPQIVLNEVARILRPGGLFWATTPSARSISYRLIGLNWSIIAPPEHIQIFSAKGLSKLLREAGFSRIKMRTHGLNPFEIIDNFHSRANENSFNRVSTAYELNESLTQSKSRQMTKNILNRTLNFLKLGDSIKIYAQKI